MSFAFYSKYSKTRTISNTYSPDKMQHVRSADCRATAEGKKHFSQCAMVSVAVSKLGKTDLVFVQPGAKVNSVYCCENVLEQSLLPAIHRISNNDFVFQQEGAPAHRHRSHHTWVHSSRKLAA